MNNFLVTAAKSPCTRGINKTKMTAEEAWELKLSNLDRKIYIVLKRANRTCSAGMSPEQLFERIKKDELFRDDLTMAQIWKSLDKPAMQLFIKHTKRHMWKARPFQKLF